MNIIIAFEVRAVESIMLLKGRIQFSSVRGYYVAWISVFNLILAVIRPLINNVVLTRWEDMVKLSVISLLLKIIDKC